MSEEKLKLKKGDYIRVIQTDDMVKKGCANRKGKIICIGNYSCTMEEFETKKHYTLKINTVIQISKEDLK